MGILWVHTWNVGASCSNDKQLPVTGELLWVVHTVRNVIPRLHDTTGCQTGCTRQPVVKQVVQPVWQPAVSCKQTSNRLSSRFDNPLDVCLHDTTGCQNGCQMGMTTGLTTLLKEQPLFVQHGCQTRFHNRVEGTAVRSTGSQTGLYNRFDNRLYTRYSRLSNRLSNGFDNRFNVCIHNTTGCQFGLTTSLTTGCIVYTNIYPVIKQPWQLV